MVLTRWFRPKEGRALFNATELAVLDAVASALNPEAAALLRGQVNGFHWIARNFDGEEVYPRPSRDTTQHDLSLAFMNRARQVRLATVSLKGSRGSGKAEMFVFDGFFGLLEFKPKPKSLGEAIVVGRVKLHADPTIPDDGAESLRRLSRLNPKISDELRRAWADQPDWAKELSPIDDLFEIELPEGTFVVLSQLPDTTFVAARADTVSPVVSRFDTDGSQVGSFTTAREAFEAPL